MNAIANVLPAPRWIPALTLAAPPAAPPAPPPTDVVCRSSWSGRLADFASDSLDAGRAFTVAGAAGWLGHVAYLSSLVWGPVIAGIGMAAGGIEVATSVATANPVERRHRLINGGLDMAISAAALVGSTGINPVGGAIGTMALIGMKLAYDVLSRPPAAP